MSTVLEALDALEEKANMAPVRSVALKDGRAVLSKAVRGGSLWLAIFDVLHDPNAERAALTVHAVNHLRGLVAALEEIRGLGDWDRVHIDEPVEIADKALAALQRDLDTLGVVD